MYNLYNTYLLDELTQDRFREADQHRMLVAAGVAQPRVRHGYNPALNWLGQRLTDLGRRLQEEHGQHRELSFR